MYTELETIMSILENEVYNWYDNFNLMISVVLPSYVDWHNSTLHLPRAQCSIFSARKTRVGVRDVLDLLTQECSRPTTDYLCLANLSS